MIILLNGSINAGKTTVAKWVTKLLPNTAHVEVDALRDFVRFLPLAESIPINLENAASVTKNLVRRGYHVVISYPLSEEDHAYLAGELAECGVPIHTFTLSPRLEVAVTNRGARELTVGEIARVREQYAAGIHNPPFGLCIDNSEQHPGETARILLDMVRESIAG
jgi:predicted kinase